MQSTTRRRIQWKQIYMPEIRWLEIIIIKIFKDLRENSKQMNENHKMNCSTPGLSVHHYLPEFPQTHIHWVSDAIQPSHPLSHPFPPAPNLSQYQGLFQWVVCCIRWTKYGSFNLSISTSNEYSNPLGLTGLISLLSERFPRGFSSTTIKKHQFFSIQPSLWPNSHICTWLLEKP